MSSSDFLSLKNPEGKVKTTFISANGSLAVFHGLLGLAGLAASFRRVEMVGTNRAERAEVAWAKDAAHNGHQGQKRTELPIVHGEFHGLVLVSALKPVGNQGKILFRPLVSVGSFMVWFLV